MKEDENKLNTPDEDATTVLSEDEMPKRSISPEDEKETDVLKDAEPQNEGMTVPEMMGAKNDAKDWAEHSAEDNDKKKKRKKGGKEKVKPTGLQVLSRILFTAAVIGLLGIGAIALMFIILPGTPEYRGYSGQTFPDADIEEYVPAEPTVLPAPASASDADQDAEEGTQGDASYDASETDGEEGE